MEQEIKAYYAITTPSGLHELERLREKAQHDEALALHHAWQKEKQESISEQNIEVAHIA